MFSALSGQCRLTRLEYRVYPTILKLSTVVTPLFHGGLLTVPPFNDCMRRPHPAEHPSADSQPVSHQKNTPVSSKLAYKVGGNTSRGIPGAARQEYTCVATELCPSYRQPPGRTQHALRVRV